MATQLSPTFNLAVTRLCDYLSTLPLAAAIRIWGLMPDGNELGDFAAGILAGLPAGFFNHTPSHLSAQRFVYENGKITIHTQANAGQQTPWPTPVAAAGGPIAEAQLPTPAQRSMNSWMVFRSFLADLLPRVPQKSRSVTISNLWQAEPAKGHWELMARAYTYLRNHYGLQDTTLAAFTRKAADFMGLPRSEDYVRALGLELAQCSLAMCSPDGQGVHYHLTNVPPDPALTFQIKTCSMVDLLKLFVEDPENVPNVNSGPVEDVMTVARDMTGTPFDSIVNPDQVDDSENEWSFADIYGVEDGSFNRDPDFTGDPLTDPIYVAMLQQDALLHMQWQGDNVFGPSAVGLQANVQ